jgi:hypothetical protein
MKILVTVVIGNFNSSGVMESSETLGVYAASQAPNFLTHDIDIWVEATQCAPSLNKSKSEKNNVLSVSNSVHP